MVAKRGNKSGKGGKPKTKALGRPSPAARAAKAVKAGKLSADAPAANPRSGRPTSGTPKPKKKAHIDIPGAADDDEGRELSDEDLDFFAEHGDHMSFLSSLSAKAISKRATPSAKTTQARMVRAALDDDLPSLDSDSEDEDSVDAPRPQKERKRQRTAAENDEAVEDLYEQEQVAISEAVAVKERLPVKHADGRLERRTQRIRLGLETPQKEAEDAAKTAADESSDEDEPLPLVPASAPVEAPKKPSSLDSYKESLAALASELLGDPEKHIDLLKALHLLATSPNSSSSLDMKKRRLGLLTQLAVFKDIIPGYRIRPLTEEEKTVKVSKDVKKVRQFEEILLGNYQLFLHSLGRIMKAKTDPALMDTAIKCVCQLLLTHPHFNFRSNLLVLIATRLSSLTFDATSKVCADALITLFREDPSGEVSLDAVKILTKMIKSRSYIVHEEVIKVFFHLRLREELHGVRFSGDGRIEKSTPGGDGALGEGQAYAKNKKRKKGKAATISNPYLSKKLRKIAKEQKGIDKEMEEAEAEYSQEDRTKMHNETLKLVFVVYFRVLKHASTSPLLPATLEGLAKFAHLISVDFFTDLLELLKQIMRRGEEGEGDEEEDEDILGTSEGPSLRSSLLCVVTAFTLLSGQGEALNIDLKDFDTHLYTLIPRLSFSSSIERHISEGVQGKAKGKADAESRLATEAELMVRAVDLLLLRRSKAPAERVVAFIKRLAIFTVWAPTPTALSTLSLIQKLLIKYPRAQALLSSEDRAGDGVYNGLVDDMAIANAYATSLWELPTLQIQHIDPKVRRAAQSILSITKSSGR